MDGRKSDDLLRRASIRNISPNIVKALAAVVAVVVVLSLARWMPMANGSEFKIASSSQEAAAGGESDQSGQEQGEADQLVVVHVAGAVNSPGVYSLPAGTRVNDAVEAAGGFADDACASSANLAREVRDGEQIVIASQEQADSAQTSVRGASDSGTSSATGRVNINTASVSQLQELPGIGPSTAQAIVDYRTQNGNFKTVEQIKEVSGIGDGRYSKIESSICV